MHSSCVAPADLYGPETTAMKELRVEVAEKVSFRKKLVRSRLKWVGHAGKWKGNG